MRYHSFVPSPSVHRGSSWRTWIGIACLLAATGCETPNSFSSSDSASGGGEAADSRVSDSPREDADGEVEARENGTSARTLRAATFNASLYGDKAGELSKTLADPEAEAPRRVAAIIQRVRPDILLINEFDRVRDGDAVEAFQAHFLARSQRGDDPIRYPHVLYPTVNTGRPSGYDLDNNGRVVSTPGSEAYANDAYGYGTYPGQYGMVLLSRYPIDRESMRSFRTFRWARMPDSALPESWYTSEELEALRLSSKTHLDVPVRVDGEALHLLISHPTPPAFGGPEHRNRRRNHDEIRLWRDYLTPERSDYLVDDAGRRGGLPEREPFVLMGDLNADPNDGAKRSRRAIADLLKHPRVTDPKPTSEGARVAARRDGGANTKHAGNPALDTTNFDDDRTGNLRVDYVLPSSRLEVRDAGVFWPEPDEPGGELIGVSDHRLVWVDLAPPNGRDG